ncbi:MAG: hypothetical protein R3251_00635 [Candidatus Spechtbacterales bacterium]|nr:hypothetical protein [Candidatus Spechtbacterales bacterium]
MSNEKDKGIENHEMITFLFLLTGVGMIYKPVLIVALVVFHFVAGALGYRLGKWANKYNRINSYESGNPKIRFFLAVILGYAYFLGAVQVVAISVLVKMARVFVYFLKDIAEYEPNNSETDNSEDESNVVEKSVLG